MHRNRRVRQAIEGAHKTARKDKTARKSDERGTGFWTTSSSG